MINQIDSDHANHPEEHLRSSDFISDIVIDMADGLIVRLLWPLVQVGR